MITSIFFQIASFFYLILLMIIYFSKERLNSFENKLYKMLIIVNFVALVLDISSVFTIINMDKISLLNTIITKAYLANLLAWIVLFTIYIFSISISTKNRNKKIQIFSKVCLIIYITYLILLIIMPLYYFNKNNAIYSYGPSAIISYAFSGIFVSLDIFYTIGNYKNIKNKKYIPIYTFIVLGIIVIIIQITTPSLLLITFIDTFITFLMYFTIENPDISIIEQLKQNKVLIEKGNEDKSNFLFRMSQEVKKPIDDIIRVNDIMRNTEDRETIKKGIKYIDYNAKELKVLVNDVLDVSKMDVYNIKMIESTYNVYNVFTEIFTRYENIINNKLEFRHNISKNIPEILFGDSVKLKQVVTTILQNAVDHTSQGYIDVNVDSIIKNDICRLIISVNDSGSGMSLDKVNELLNIQTDLTEEDINKLDKMNLDLNIATKIVRLLGGQIIIKSEVNSGSEFIIALEQKIEKKDNDISLLKKIDEYSNLSSKKRRVLVVDDKKNDLDNISNYLEKNNIEVVKSMYGQDCIDRINNKQKFDLILMEDEMVPLTGINTLQKLQQIPHFKTTVIIMLDKNKEAIKNHYIEDGFKDYLLKENLDSELSRIIKKYL